MNLPKTPALTVDAIIEKNGEVLLIKRKNFPFKGAWALPGGFVEIGEDVEKAIVREVLEETGLDVDIENFQGVYSKPGRDPRGHVVSLCYVAKPRADVKPRGGSDSIEAAFFDIELLKDLELAFDHKRILSEYLERKDVLREV